MKKGIHIGPMGCSQGRSIWFGRVLHNTCLQQRHVVVYNNLTDLENQAWFEWIELIDELDDIMIHGKKVD